MKVQRLKCSLRGQVRSHSPVFAARQRYVEDVVAHPTVRCLRDVEDMMRPPEQGGA